MQNESKSIPRLICTLGLTCSLAFASAGVAVQDKKPVTKPEPPKVTLPKPTPRSPTAPKAAPSAPAPTKPSSPSLTSPKPTAPKPAPVTAKKHFLPKAFHCPKCQREIGTCMARPTNGTCYYQGPPKCPACGTDVAQVSHMHMN